MHYKLRMICLAVAGFSLLVIGCPRTQPRVVLYCAQDENFAKQSLEEFSKRNGIEVAPKFDTEADKSVSLYLNIVQEKDRPRCDVFWNNEVLSTIRLERKGLLEQYESPMAKPFPDWTKGKDHTWQAFADRARIITVNKKQVPENEWPRSILDLTNKRWKGRVVMARPMHGTSATQAACLFEVLGKEEGEKYYRDLLANDLQVAPGNKQVAEWVGKGRTPSGTQVDIGITDTDDAMEEIKSDSKVAIIFPDSAGNEKFPRMGTLFIPNTLAIIRGGPNPKGTQRLVDYLLSPEVEARLAESASYQFPLNPNVKAKIAPELEGYKKAKRMGVDFYAAAELWDEVQEFLKKEFPQ